MSYSAALLCVISFYEGNIVPIVGVKLVSLNHSRHALQLYQELRNEEAPSEIDQATSDIRFRKRICRDIWDSGFFHSMDLVPADMSRLYRELNNQMHNYVLSRNLYKSANPYKQMRFRVAVSYFFDEHVFVCPFKNPLKRNIIITYYVSKEYNVSAAKESYLPGRFIFGNLLPEHPDSSYYMILAEEPANVHNPPDSNVELYYLRRRKYVQLAKVNAIDPFCKLVSGDVLDPRNQYYRLCVAVLRSSRFKDKISYPHRAPTFSCDALKVSFRTKEGIAEAAEESYYERMTLCWAERENSKRLVHLYISRSYHSNQVFVYYGNPSDHKIYLDNLSTNISILDELNSFDFVED